MSAPHPIALLGFSAFERDALASCFRLAINREPHYEHVPVLTDAELMIVDADDRPAVELVSAIERLADCVFIGATAPAGVGHRIARPIDPVQVMRLLDAMVAGRQPPPGHGEDAGRRRTVILPARREPPLLPGMELDFSPEAPAPTETPPAIAPASAEARPPEPSPAPPPAAPPTEPPAPAREATEGEDPPSLDLRLAAEPMPVRGPPARPAPEVSLLQPSTPAVAPMPTHGQPAPAAWPPSPAMPPVPVRALVVDDSELAQRFLLTRLERYGLLVDCTGRSDVALSMLARRSHDFVFLDMELGDTSPLDGLALCQQIRRDQATRMPPSVVVVVTAHTGELDRVRGMLAGCDAFLGKPLDEHELERLLARHGLMRKPLAPPS